MHDLRPNPLGSESDILFSRPGLEGPWAVLATFSDVWLRVPFVEATLRGLENIR